MAQVCDPALVADPEALDHLLHRFRYGLLGAVQDTRVGVALEDNVARAPNLDGLGRVLQPIHSYDVVAEAAGRVQGVPGALGEDCHRDGIETHTLQLLRQLLGNMRQVRLGEPTERRRAEFSGPRVEHHHQLISQALSASKDRACYCALEPYLSPGLDLEGEVINTDVGNLVQQLLGLLRILVDPRLALRKELGATSLDHVAEQGPGRTAEANQGNPASQLLPGERDGLVDVVQLVGDVDRSVEDGLVLAVGGRLQGVREVRALLVHHLDHHAHGLRDDEDVGEDDGGI